jgi:hypothetical protein
MIVEMPDSDSRTLDGATGRYGRTATQDAINRHCLLAQTRRFGSLPVDLEEPVASDVAAYEHDELAEPFDTGSKPSELEAAERDYAQGTLEELDGDNLTEMLRLPIRSNFRVLARISQILRDSPGYA